MNTIDKRHPWKSKSQTTNKRRAKKSENEREKREGEQEIIIRTSCVFENLLWF